MIQRVSSSVYFAAAGALGSSLLLSAVCTTCESAKADTLTICTEASPDALNAQLSSTSFDVSEQVADRLVEMEPGGSEIVPSLAEAWQVSPDGLTYTFKLRKGVRFHSNRRFAPTREMNADDVVFSFRRMFDQSNPFFKSADGKFPEFLDLLQPSLQAVEKTDDRTVVFRLKSPLAPLLPTLSIQPFSILSEEYAARLTQLGRVADLDTELIGTGPFSFVRYDKDLSVRFHAFHGFWGAPDRAAKVDSLVFAITPDASVRDAKVRANECQVARYPNLNDLTQLRADPNVQVQEVGMAATNYIYFNLDRKPFGDLRVRQAMAMAIDYDALASIAFHGAIPAASLVPPALWGHNPALKPYRHDPQGAKKLLAEAGYPDGFTTDLWTIPVVRPYMPNGKRVAEMIQYDWEKIGVRARIVMYEWGEYLKRIRDGEANVAMLGDFWDYPDPSEVMLEFVCTSPDNSPRFCNRSYDDLMRRANLVTDQAERARLYQKAQQIIYDNIPLVRLADMATFAAVRREVKGLRLQALGSQRYGGVSLAK
jgi:dipeptide transport system substrate-binding protein